MPQFEIVSDFGMTGDQPQAVDKLVEGLNKGFRHQTLLGVTGSGKTFTMANVVERVQRPTLVICHNKTLAAQLCTEFKEFFPTTRWNTLSAIMTTTSLKPTSHAPTSILRKRPI